MPETFEKIYSRESYKEIERQVDELKRREDAFFKKPREERNMTELNKLWAEQKQLKGELGKLREAAQAEGIEEDKLRQEEAAHSRIEAKLEEIFGELADIEKDIIL